MIGWMALNSIKTKRIKMNIIFEIGFFEFDTHPSNPPFIPGRSARAGQSSKVLP